MKTQIILTGSTGFVGQNLISYLDSEIFKLKFISRVELAEISSEVLDGSDVIIHLAGKAHDLKKVSNSSDYYKINFELTKRLYDAFLKSDAEKFIFVSSVKAAADSVDGVLTEETTAAPTTHYGKSKLMAEEYIQEQHLPVGKSYFILRPSMIHGPGNKGNLNLLYQVVRSGVPYPLAAFSNNRSFLSVENLCFVISELTLRSDVNSGVYQVSDDEPLSTNEIIAIFSASIGKKTKLWHIAPSFIKFLSKIGDKLHLTLTTERLEKLTENYVISNKKISKALNKSLPVSAKDGLKVTAISFQNSVK